MLVGIDSRLRLCLLLSADGDLDFYFMKRAIPKASLSIYHLPKLGSENILPSRLRGGSVLSVLSSYLPPSIRCAVCLLVFVFAAHTLSLYLQSRAYLLSWTVPCTCLPEAYHRIRPHVHHSVKTGWCSVCLLPYFPFTFTFKKLSYAFMLLNQQAHSNYSGRVQLLSQFCRPGSDGTECLLISSS